MRPVMFCLVLSYGVDENELLYKNLIAQEEADATATIVLVLRFILDSYDFLEEHLNRYSQQLSENRQKLEFLYRF